MKGDASCFRHSIIVIRSSISSSHNSKNKTKKPFFYASLTLILYRYV